MEFTLDASSRDVFGKNAVRRLRRDGRIPAVLYGGQKPGEPPVSHSIAVDPKALMRILHSGSGINTLIGLTVDGGAPTRVMVREFLLDPVTHRPLHADFCRIAMDKAIHVTVPIAVRGEAVGVKLEGGLLDFVHREVEVECLPGDIPEHIDVDVTGLSLGQAVRVRDLPGDPRWKAVSDADMMLVHVVTLKVEEAPAAEVAPVAAPATPAEPEVIKKGKVEKPETEE